MRYGRKVSQVPLHRRIENRRQPRIADRRPILRQQFDEFLNDLPEKAFEEEQQEHVTRLMVEI